MDTNSPPSVSAFSFDPLAYRKAISQFSTGIAIVTADDIEGQVHGMTVNSFTSISLNPPAVMISLKLGKMHRLISEQGLYGVSILHAGQLDYSSHFGGRPDPLLNPDFVVRDRVPTVQDSLAWFECKITERIQVEDHTLFIAHVTAYGHSEGVPLVFFSSRYQSPVMESS